jgi:methylthioribulose-1-phosphate dehydratase
MQFSEAAEQIVQAGQWLAARGWAPATAGNYSVRLDDSRIAITVSGRHKGRLTVADVMLVDYEGRAVDERHPSAETPLHVLMYRTVPTVGAVVHTHSIQSTVLGVTEPQRGHVQLEGYEMLKAFPGIGSHEAAISVPIFDNTQDMSALAQRVAERLRNDACYGYVIRGHGLYTWGPSMQEALRSVEALEFLFACEAERRRLPS